MTSNGSPWLLRFGLLLFALGGYFVLDAFAYMLVSGRSGLLGNAGVELFLGMVAVGLGLYYIISAALDKR